MTVTRFLLSALYVYLRFSKRPLCHYSTALFKDLLLATWFLRDSEYRRENIALLNAASMYYYYSINMKLYRNVPTLLPFH